VKQRRVNIGIIGGGLMGKELFALVGRWDALLDHPARPAITAIADPSPDVQNWFREVGVPNIYSDYKDLLSNTEIDVVYIAVPHNLHEEIYLATIAAGKDFLGEKPFGIDLEASQNIVSAVKKTSLFVRVSSELPFYPGAQAVVNFVKSGAVGEILEVRSGLLHSSDIDITKPINWKRQVRYCGEIGVMGDLGMHAAHLPLRLGFKPQTVYALIDKVVLTRKNSEGIDVPCDTSDNAVLAIKATESNQKREFPMFWEMKRIAPGESNTWFIHIMGMKGGAAFSTRNPAIFERFTYDGKEQVWSQIQPGHKSNWPVITGAIFEFGFPDALLQMWAAYLAEREGKLGNRFACAGVEEALDSHRVFNAALKSHSNGAQVQVK
jgi:predicted dehydrogenase